MFPYSGTLKESIELSGIGVHTGEKVNLKIQPSKLHRGITFKRKDHNGIEFKLDPRKAISNHSTIIVYNGFKIYTIEHLLASLKFLGIDNATIELDGNEIPIMDGSSYIFVKEIERVGIKFFPEKRQYLRIKSPFKIEENGRKIEVFPSDYLKIYYFISYSHPLIENQEKSIIVTKDSFATEIAPARTYGFLDHVDILEEKGIIKGASLENSIVLTKDGILNGPLRFKDEFVRHKILDFLGDLSILEFSILGCINIYKGGHSLHLKFINYILDNPDLSELIELSDGKNSLYNITRNI
ncbi:MAG: UDP-3-O-acyl-N-acetylglucosamine deacetylase [Acidobacteriota bacterium]